MAICPTREIPIPVVAVFMILTSPVILVSIANYISLLPSSEKMSSSLKIGCQQISPRPDVLAVADRLHSAAIHLLRRVRKQDVATGEGPARLSALSVLVFGGPKTLGELAAAEQVKPPTMSRIVGRSGSQPPGRQSQPIPTTRAACAFAPPPRARLLQKGRRAAHRLPGLASRQAPSRRTGEARPSCGNPQKDA